MSPPPTARVMCSASHWPRGCGRRAAASLDGILVPAGEVFSFWRQVGRTTRRRGYVTGRMLQQGCFVPSTGGGLCQISTALYEAALDSGCEIVERHAHSRIVPGAFFGVKSVDGSAGCSVVTGGAYAMPRP